MLVDSSMGKVKVCDCRCVYNHYSVYVCKKKKKKNPTDCMDVHLLRSGIPLYRIINLW